MDLSVGIAVHDCLLTGCVHARTSAHMNIHELNEQRIAARHLVENLGVMNRPQKAEDMLKADAAYALASDAWMRAEQEYAKALAGLSTAELLALTTA